MCLLLQHPYQNFTNCPHTHTYTVRSTLEMEEAHFSKMLILIYRSTQHHIPEGGTLQSQRKKSQTSQIMISYTSSLFLVNTKKATLLPSILEYPECLIPVCQVAVTNCVKSNT